MIGFKLKLELKASQSKVSVTATNCDQKHQKSINSRIYDGGWLRVEVEVHVTQNDRCRFLPWQLVAFAAWTHIGYSSPPPCLSYITKVISFNKTQYFRLRLSQVVLQWMSQTIYIYTIYRVFHLKKHDADLSGGYNLACLLFYQLFPSSIGQELGDYVV